MDAVKPLGKTGQHGKRTIKNPVKRNSTSSRAGLTLPNDWLMVNLVARKLLQLAAGFNLAATKPNNPLSHLRYWGCKATPEQRRAFLSEIGAQLAPNDQPRKTH
jgi:hypothetical protein